MSHAATAFSDESPRTITSEMIVEMEKYRRSRPGRGFAEARDKYVWSRICDMETKFRRGQPLTGPMLTLHAFTHEVRALILTAVAQLELTHRVTHRERARCGCRCFSPEQRLSSMYKARRIAEPDAPVKAILENIVESLDV